MSYKSINSKYILVEKLTEEKQEGFQTVEVQDNFVYKGRVKELPGQPTYIDSYALEVGDTVLFAKYGPDSHEIDGDKFVAVSDILAVD